jgi:hypothetical protein
VRWFKHLSMAHTDAAVSAILEEMGAEAYGVWWLILEDIASPMEKNSRETFAIHSDVKWSQICYCSARKFRSIANRLQEKGLIVCTSIDNRLKIDVPKLLKFRDEYSKKSGHSPDSRTDTDTDGDTDGELTTVSPAETSPPATQPDLELTLDELADLEKERLATLAREALRKKAVNEGIDRLFSYYCRKLNRDPTRYTLTPARRKKAQLRMEEREKRSDLETAISEAKQCIDNLAASEHNRTGGYLDWTEQIFRSAEEFEKRLNWRKPEGGSNAAGRTFTGTRSKSGQVIEDLRRSLEEDGFPVGFGKAGDTPAGQSGQGDDGLLRGGPDADGRDGRALGPGITLLPATG